MTILEGIRDYLKTCPGLAGLTLGDLGEEPGAACLRAVPGELEQTEYLDGASLRRMQILLLVRRGFGGAEESRAESLEALEELAETLKQGTRRGGLPDLGAGRRAWSLRPVELAADVQEDGWLVDQMTIALTYFQEG